MYRTCMVSDPVTIIDVAHNIKHDIAHFPFFFSLTGLCCKFIEFYTAQMKICLQILYQGILLPAYEISWPFRFGNNVHGNRGIL